MHDRLKKTPKPWLFLVLLLGGVVLPVGTNAWAEDSGAFEDAGGGLFGERAWFDRFTLGGYGEAHFNATMEEGVKDGKEVFDLHRIVLYLGYDFNDWIVLHSETELEHAFVNEGNGEVSLEQFYIDFLLCDHVNIRAGRVLAPLGIINKWHEPPTFNGVERPSFSKYIIPTTWSLDGVGIFGNITSNLKYEAYVSSSLDGSKFTAVDGIRKGRMKERPGLSEPGFSARLDFFPLANLELETFQDLRLGASMFIGGLDNGNKGDDPGIDGDLNLYSADFEYTISRFDLRGVFAYGKISGAADIGNNVATDIVGGYVEGAWHFWPEGWKRGKLDDSDAVLFARYEDFDTQNQVPSGVTKNEAGDRNEVTVGISFYPVHNLVVKADYQFKDDETDDEVNDQFNLGIGWQF